jgi:hypothetical protein
MTEERNLWGLTHDQCANLIVAVGLKTTYLLREAVVDNDGTLRGNVWGDLIFPDGNEILLYSHMVYAVCPITEKQTNTELEKRKEKHDIEKLQREMMEFSKKSMEKMNDAMDGIDEGDDWKRG